MTRLRWMATHLLPAVVATWWLTWVDVWSQIGDELDPDYQRDERSRDLNNHIHETDIAGGWGAGTGSDAD